jgi:hypothetical protein
MLVCKWSICDRGRKKDHRQSEREGEKEMVEIRVKPVGGGKS